MKPEFPQAEPFHRLKRDLQFRLFFGVLGDMRLSLKWCVELPGVPQSAA